MQPAKYSCPRLVSSFVFIISFFLFGAIFTKSVAALSCTWDVTPSQVLRDQTAKISVEVDPNSAIGCNRPYYLRAQAVDRSADENTVAWYTTTCESSHNDQISGFKVSGDFTPTRETTYNFFLSERNPGGSKVCTSDSQLKVVSNIVWSPDPLPNVPNGTTQLFSVTIYNAVLYQFYSLTYQKPDGTEGNIALGKTGTTILSFSDNQYNADMVCTHTINVKDKDGIVLSSRSFLSTPCKTIFNADTILPCAEYNSNGVISSTISYRSIISVIPPGEVLAGDPAYYKSCDSNLQAGWCSTTKVKQESPDQSKYIFCTKWFPSSCSEIPNLYKENFALYINNIRQSNVCVGGSDGHHGPHDPFLTHFSIDPTTCKNYGSQFLCQLYATALGVGGAYRFGAATGGTITKVAGFSDPHLDCEAIGEEWNIDQWVGFQPSESGQLESVDVWAENPGGDTWMNMRITEDDGSTGSLLPAIRGANGEVAEAGGFITSAGPFSNWVNFSFLGSQPVLDSHKKYRIYLKYDKGQLISLPLCWRNHYYHNIYGNMVNDRFYQVWIRKNAGKDAGGFGDGFVNPGYPFCPGPAFKCWVWWKPPGPGHYDFSADILVGDAKTSATTLTTGVTVTMPINPWFKNQGGDIHSDGNIQSPIPSTVSNKNFSEDLNGYPGLVSNGLSSTVSLDPAGTISSTGWLANTGLGPIYNYDSFWRKLGQPSIDNFSCDPDCPTPPSGVTTVYYSTDDITIVGQGWTIPANTKVVVLVNGDLEIDKTITAPVGSFLAFIVKGNINISGKVGDKSASVVTPHLQGIYFTDGSIDTYFDKGVGLGSGKRLVAAGIFYAKQGFNLKRDLKNDTIPPATINNNTTPAELFISRPDLMINAPKELFTSSLNWQEVSP